MRRLLVWTALMAFALAVTPALAAPNMQDGIWEITSTAEMPGMPFTMPATTYSQCITQQDLIPQTQDPQQKCEVIDNRNEGDTVIWKVHCTTEGGPMTSEGRITYHGDRFEGVVTTTGAQLPGGMKQTMTGKRIGPCQ